MTLNFPTEYILESIRTGKQFPDDGWTLDAPMEDAPSLIRAIYKKKQLDVKDPSFGVFRFADWLPLQRFLEGSSAPVTYQSEALAEYLGLSSLYITFSGYWPEKGALMPTCSFKETEAYAVCGRLSAKNSGVLVVASAGNTARAFARVCSDNQIPLLLFVPQDNINALWFDKEISSCVRLLTTTSGSDYYDAIHLSNIVCGIEGYCAEGGARNVARRDGMGTTVLSAAHTIGRIPDYYFQAIGSGTGAIAAWEANIRLINDGNYGDHKMKLMVSQNIPFIPVYDAWKAGSRHILPLDDELSRRQVEQISAKVLSNRKPPYGIAGGLYDALSDSHGDVITATNQEALEAAILFETLEGNDIHPAAAIATASLIKETKAGRIPSDACVMLNITGGGEKRFKNKHDLYRLTPDHIFNIEPDPYEVKEVLKRLFPQIP